MKVSRLSRGGQQTLMRSGDQHIEAIIPSMNNGLVVAALMALVIGIAAPARADLTGFVGVNPTPSNRLVRGFAGGFALVIIGFEFEYAETNEDETADAPSLKTGMGNVYLQTPFPVSGFQFYGIMGGGVYRERLGLVQETHVGANVGGGVKFVLAGPLQLRLDYRIFTLRGTPLHVRPQRLYAGLNLAF
jgi:hypothetical protein